MVQPRLRNTGGGDLYLPHAYGGDDAECKSSSRKLEKRLRLWYYRFGGGSPKNQAEMLLKVMVFLIGCYFLKALVTSVLGFLVVGESQYPWKGMSRPASLTKPRSPSKIYSVPGSMSTLGDKTDFYAQLRKAYDSRFPPDEKRSLEAVQNLQKFDIEAFHVTDLKKGQAHYDIYNCPEQPPPGYPMNWRIMDILNHWPADDPEPRAQIYHSLCVFEYTKDLHKARRYRDAELPFVIRGDPAVNVAVERWNTPYFLNALLGEVEHDTQYSITNHFLYFNKNEAKPSGWKEPTQLMTMSYHDWVHRANVSDSKLGPTMPHWYFRVSGCREGKTCDLNPSEFIWDELPHFQPRPNNLYVKEPKWQKGIFCRFGMKGVIAENHFDGDRNFVSVLSGERRYILAHPDQCTKMSLYPQDHPSNRHSAIDWSDPDLSAHPSFAAARGSEVVLQAGESLFIPCFWFHHIISLSMNVQCSTRSGISFEHEEAIQQCGYSNF